MKSLFKLQCFNNIGLQPAVAAEQSRMRLVNAWRYSCVLGIIVIVSQAGTSGCAFAQTQTAQPLLVLIHGRDQTVENPKKLEERWNASLNEGLSKLGAPSAIPAGTRKFIWYGDIYGVPRPEIPSDCQFASFVSDFEWDRLKQTLLAKLVSIVAAAHLDQVVAKRFVNDTYKYFSDITYRCQTNNRLSSILDETLNGKRPIVLVGHSMGGIVSLAVLRQNSTANEKYRYHIARLVTLGTQIGVEEVIKAIDGSYVKLPVAEPQNIHSWVNLRNQGDPLAFNVRNSFNATDKNRLPIEKIAERRPNKTPHAATLYLSNPRTAFAILEAWCSAFSENTTKPALCTKSSVQDIATKISY